RKLLRASCLAGELARRIQWENGEQARRLNGSLFDIRSERSSISLYAAYGRMWNRFAPQRLQQAGQIRRERRVKRHRLQREVVDERDLVRVKRLPLDAEVAVLEDAAAVHRVADDRVAERGHMHA